MRKVYLDSNATTKVYPEVAEAIQKTYSDQYGNASSVHSFGRDAKKYLEAARIQVASLINAGSAEEIVFTSGGTESDNFAIKGAVKALKEKGNHIITSSVEHPAVLNTCKSLEKEGFQVTYLAVDECGVINLDELKNSITSKTILITIMAANNETGTLMPIEEIGKIAEETGILFHTDAVQMVGKMPFDVQKVKAQLVSLSAHKINGPKGAGALYIKKGTRLEPIQHGGHQEKGRRAGTENIPAIVGFGKACQLAKERLTEYSERTKKLRDMLYNRIEKEIKQIKLNGHPAERLPNTLNVSFKSLEGESIILSLDLEGIATSTGSACTSGSLEPSHVLKSMGVEPLSLQGSVRFSFGAMSAESDVEYVMEKLPPIITRLRKMSPVYEDA
ncbi:MAG: cysteine desulfurase NifS [Candidatus Omnitrophota bacterium]